MLREKPSVSDNALVACLEREYGLGIDAATFLPLGYDSLAAVYRIDAHDRNAYFLKLTRRPIVPAHLRIPRALLDSGITNVLAPLRTLRHALWCTLDEYSLVLYPFIQGQNAMRQGMTDQQWITFGATLNAIHSSGLAATFVDEIPHETFSSPMIDLVRSIAPLLQTSSFDLPAQQELAGFWHENSALIQHLTERVEQLGRTLQAEQLATVLCHGDVHAANIMLDHEGGLYIVDWDTPRIAPRERDLLFIVGSIIARTVTPHEEACFFQGYGLTAINWRALTYYRYERALEDVYEGARSVFLDSAVSAAVKTADAHVTMGLFRSGDIVQSALQADQRLDRG